jgi:hypothetical protein
MRKRRAGKTQTIGVSVSKETLALLKERADRLHGGNVSALITEYAAQARRDEAFDRAWAWYGGPEPTPEERLEILSEILSAPKRKAKKKAAA